MRGSKIFQYGGGALDSADGYSTLSGGSSGGSSGSEAPAYSDIHGDPVIAYQVRWDINQSVNRLIYLKHNENLYQ